MQTSKLVLQHLHAHVQTEIQKQEMIVRQTKNSAVSVVLVIFLTAMSVRKFATVATVHLKLAVARP